MGATRSALDHNVEYFPLDPASGSYVCTLNNQTDPASVLYRYGIFGDLRFIDKCQTLASRQEYDNLIRRLEHKQMEIQTWIGEPPSFSRNSRHPLSEGETDDDDQDEIDQGHWNRIAYVDKFIEEIRSIQNKLYPL